jgi:ABC-type transporter Mla subunit MlaD
MGDSRIEKIKVGILVIGGLIVFIVGYFWLSQISFHKKKYHYRIRFKEVGWINKGDIVTVLGVPKGRVEGIELYPESVIVKIWIEDYPLRKGARAWLESMGFMDR